MLVIGISLVSLWKSLSPGDFQAWFATQSHLFGRVMIPLGVGSVAAAVAAAVAGWRGQTRRWLLVAAVARSMGNVALGSYGLGALGFVAALRALQR
jgi:hypothetical protein